MLAIPLCSAAFLGAICGLAGRPTAPRLFVTFVTRILSALMEPELGALRVDQISRARLPLAGQTKHADKNWWC